MRLRRALALAGAVTAVAFTACKELPFAPAWDADWYLPLSTRAIHLNQRFTFGFFPPSTSDTVSFPPQKQDVSGVIRDVLKNLVTDPTRAQTTLALTVGKQTAVSVTDTLFLASDSSGLTPNAQDTTVVFPISLTATDLSKTDSISLSAAQINMLRNTVTTSCTSGLPSGGCSVPSEQLWVQLRGRVSNTSPSPITITSADSLTVKLTVTARIAVSHK